MDDRTKRTVEALAVSSPQMYKCLDYARVTLRLVIEKIHTGETTEAHHTLRLVHDMIEETVVDVTKKLKEAA